MKKLLGTTTLLLVAFSGTANAAIENRGQCYDKVVAHCNTTAHPVPCSSSGFDECDKEFSSIIDTTPKFKLKQQRRAATAQIQRAPTTRN